MLGLVFGTAVIAWVVDFLTKEWVLASMTEGEHRQVLGEILQWHFVRNPGAAFSLAEGSTWIFTILASAVVIFILTQVRRIRSLLWAAALGGLLGGTLGNLTDRLTREPGVFVGHVIDFIQVWGFPAIFNVADIFVVGSMIGVVLLVLANIGLDGVRHTDEPKRAAVDADPDATQPLDPEDRPDGSNGRHGERPGDRH
ncbi:signal peptidase II Aspartic peptidase. MEROPS family A08 [Agrococcus baldri]|uniref:Lipoprotein signal peptidase n=1 Tax=Agrococcus baldri TaxID=153730 RepID=A0AA94L0C0_9MICO|nr:signal peptidase II [Agrococcus baldri]SFS17659.1 signal peptidase II Aspartic peptidase. MEROPS family A08 [Agrococcus baldri]